LKSLKLEEHHSPSSEPLPLSTEKFNLTFLLPWSTRFLQKLRDFLKSTRRTRAGNRSDHLHRRKRKVENLFSSLLALATPFSRRADTVAGQILTSNEFLKNFGLAINWTGEPREREAGIQHLEPRREEGFGTRSTFHTSLKMVSGKP
jgi:hypothetical protein